MPAASQKRQEHFKAGERVKVIAAPGKLKPHLDKEGEVLAIPCQNPVYLVTVRFDDDLKVTLQGAYLKRVRALQTRRGAFHMYVPGDTRSEEERKLAGIGWLVRLGYRVLDTDSHRGKAICGKCTREAKKIPGNQKAVVYGSCPKCKAPVFSPTTGADSGVPDTLVWRNGYPRGGGFLLEWKDGEDGKRRPDQADLEEMGMIVVAWDEPSMAYAVVAYEREIGVEPLRALVELAGSFSPKN